MVELLTSGNIFEQINLLIGKILKPIIRNPPPKLIFPEPIIKPLPKVQLPIETKPTPEERLEFLPKKDFSKPVLWKYYPNKSKDIWYAVNYQDYIQPNNELVAYLVERIEFDNITYPGYINIVYKGTNLSINLKYRIDDGRLCTESGQDTYECNSFQDFWMNPDYYIWNELEGDCEDYAILIGSICERLNIPYMIVAGYAQGIRDWWAEFIYKENIYIAQVNMNLGNPRLLSEVSGGFKPFIMFNKKILMTEYREWYKDYNTT